MTDSIDVASANKIVVKTGPHLRVERVPRRSVSASDTHRSGGLGTGTNSNRKRPPSAGGVPTKGAISGNFLMDMVES